MLSRSSTKAGVIKTLLIKTYRQTICTHVRGWCMGFNMVEISAIHRISVFCSPGQIKGIRRPKLHHVNTVCCHIITLWYRQARNICWQRESFRWSYFLQVIAQTLSIFGINSLKWLQISSIIRRSCCWEKSARTCLLILTNILHRETVALVEIGDVVLATELHAVSDPNRCVVPVKEALPVRMDVLRTLFPFTGRWAERWKP